MYYLCYKTIPMTIFPTLLLSATLALHPMHVSYTNIDINTETKEVSVSHKLYANDFTLLFFHLFEKNIIPSDTASFTQPEIDLIDHYMKYRFFLLEDQDTLSLHFAGKHMEDEYLWLKFVGKIKDAEIHEMAIHNMLLLDLYMDQTNLVIVNNGPVEKGYTFNWDNRQSVLTFNQ